MTDKTYPRGSEEWKYDDWLRYETLKRDLDNRNHTCPTCGAPCRCEEPKHCGHCA